MIHVKNKQSFQIIENEFHKYLNFLCNICAFEARAHDRIILDQMTDFIRNYAKEE